MPERPPNRAVEAVQAMADEIAEAHGVLTRLGVKSHARRAWGSRDPDWRALSLAERIRELQGMHLTVARQYLELAGVPEVLEREQRLTDALEEIADTDASGLADSRPWAMRPTTRSCR